MLTWLADVLREAGCKVIEEDGWKTRGRPSGAFDPKAVMLHHDASPAGETSNGVDVIRDGRPGLEGPLAQLWLAYDGTWHVVAAGRANHAGEGGPWGVVSQDDGNADCIGIETDHTTDELWTGGQRSEGLKGVAALCVRLGITTREEIDRAVLAHKEYTSRKVDPDPLNMTTARANLLRYIEGGPDDQEGFVQYTARASDTEQTFTPGEWLNIRMADPSDDVPSQFGIAAGPAHFVLDVVLTVERGTPGRSLMIRAVNTKGDADNVVAAHPIEQYAATDEGSQHFAYRAQGFVGDGQWLRAQLTTDVELSVVRSETRVTLW